MLVVRVNGRDHRVRGLPELDGWRRDGRVTDATPVYDPDADGWRTVGDLLGTVPATPPPGANVAAAPSGGGAVGDFLAKAASRPRWERLKYSVFNPPWVRCPNCGHEGKAQLKGWGVTTWGVVKLILAVTLGPTVAFIAMFAEPEWGWLVWLVVVYEVGEFFVKLVVLRPDMRCARCNFSAPVPQEKRT